MTAPAMGPGMTKAGLMRVLQPWATEMAMMARTPRVAPIRPPRVPRSADSARNWTVMWRGLAPSDRRSPISGVRSRMATSVVLAMPTAALALVSVRQAAAYLVAQALVGLLVLVQFNGFAVVTGIATQIGPTSTVGLPATGDGSYPGDGPGAPLWLLAAAPLALFGVALAARARRGNA